MEIGQAAYRFTPITMGGVTKDLWAVEITEGKFKGFKFQYSSWVIKPDPAKPEKRRLSFNYDIIDCPADMDGTKKNLELMSLLGNVLLNILVEVARIPAPGSEQAKQETTSESDANVE